MASAGLAMLTRLLRRPSTDDDLACYHRHLESRLSGVECYPGVESALDEVAALVPVAVFTGAGRGATEILLRHAGLSQYFTLVVCGDEVGKTKPAPDGLWAVCKALGVRPSGAAYVGDSPRDLQAAKSAGVLAVAAGWGHEYNAEVWADVVVHKPSELKTLVSPSG